MFMIIFILTIEKLCSFITLFKFVHFFAVVARVRRESTSNFTFFGGREHTKTSFLFLFLNLETVFNNSPAEKLPIFAELNEME